MKRTIDSVRNNKSALMGVMIGLNEKHAAFADINYLLDLISRLENFRDMLPEKIYENLQGTKQ